MEEVRSSNGGLVAIVVRNDFKKEGINFLSSNHFPLQLGINGYKKGVKIKPHIHRDREITINILQEVLYIKEGELMVDLYDANKAFFKSLKLSTGDLIFFVSGGHGFEMLNDVTIVEVKQGPYFGKDSDKVLI